MLIKKQNEAKTITQYLKKSLQKRELLRIFYILFLLILSVGSLAIIFQFDDNFKDLVDFATTLSFVIAPVIAVFNYRLATGRFLPKELQPYVPMKVLSVAGIVFLVAFVALFVSVRFLGLTL